MCHSKQENGGSMLLFCFKLCTRFCYKNTFVEKPAMNSSWKTSSTWNQQICVEVIRDELWGKYLACLKRTSYLQLGFTALFLLPTSLLCGHTHVKKYFFILIITGSVVQFHYFLHLILSVSKGIIKVQCQTTALCLTILSI